MFESEYTVFPVIVRVVQINIDAPRHFLSQILMLLVVGVSCDPDAIVRNLKAVLDGCSALTPLEVEDVVRDVVPVLPDVLRVVDLLVDAARLVNELGASGPASGQRPGALRGVEKELLDALARVETLDVAAAVLRHPIDSVCAWWYKVKTSEGDDWILSAIFDTFELLAFKSDPKHTYQ